MTADEYLKELRERAGLTKMGPAFDGNILCCDQNHTHFEVPDPDEMPEDARRAVLELVLSHLAEYALGY